MIELEIKEAVPNHLYDSMSIIVDSVTYTPPEKRIVIRDSRAQYIELNKGSKITNYIIVFELSPSHEKALLDALTNLGKIRVDKAPNYFSDTHCYVIRVFIQREEGSNG